MELTFEDESTLSYCAHCGAPQIVLGQDLRERAQEQDAGEAGGAAVAIAAGEDPSAVRWKPMVQLSGAVSMGFALFTMMLPPLSLLVPAITLALYAGRFRTTRITPGLGARVGLLCGLLLTAVMGVLGAGFAAILRFRTNEMGTFDAALAQQIRARMAQQPSPDAAAMALFSVPEVRAGVALCCFSMMAVMVVAGLTLSGALAGMARSRATPRLSV
jgi:hypothetical protein